MYFMKKLFLFVSVTMTFHAFTMESNHQEMFAQFQSLPVELQRIILIQSFKPTIMSHSFKLKSQLKGFKGELIPLLLIMIALHLLAHRTPKSPDYSTL